MDALRGLALLLLCQSAGEVTARGFDLPLPGPVLGMLLMLALLAWPALRTPVGAAADAVLSHLSLLFVPVGVGVVTHLALLGEYGGRLTLVLLLSTLVGLAVTALTLRALLPAAAADAGHGASAP
ncbi:MAG: CidA/LrgA family protein [Leptothrix sp. (in: Bacteria)]|nr:CidA/LrgA family protein [Leptothrix sp. (in: b-proteobacteria)]